MGLPSDKVRVLGMLVGNADAGNPPRAGSKEMSADLGIGEDLLVVWRTDSRDHAPGRPDLAVNCYFGDFVGGGLVEVRGRRVYPTQAGREELARYDENYRPLAS